MSEPLAIFKTLAPWPAVDFSAFGEVETVPLSKIQKLTGSFLGRNWLAIPHVTHNHDADITELEACRTSLGPAADGVKLTPLPFLVRAVVSALKAYPKFNASLDETGTNLVLKRYFHIGIATDTPNGLLVPVLRDCDRKGTRDIASEIARVAEQARTKGLPMAQMSGGCFTISSLGALGGTGFTPIINAPEVAILGVGRTRIIAQPGADGESVVWRKVLPLSLSYDHRVNNGADAGRFLLHVEQSLREQAAQALA